MGILFLLLFLIGGVWLVFGVVLGALGLAFRLGFWVLQLVGGLIGFLLFGSVLPLLLGVLLVCNLIGLPLLLIRRR